MINIKLILRIVGYTGIGLFFIQLLNLYINLFKPSNQLFKYSIFIGFASLLSLVILERLTNKEDRHYSKNVEK